MKKLPGKNLEYKEQITLKLGIWHFVSVFPVTRVADIKATLFMDHL